MKNLVIVLTGVATISSLQQTCGGTDNDGDGWSVEDGDCNDDDATVHPLADEYCNDVDDNCDGIVDNNAVDVPTWYRDQDGDGYGDALYPVSACDAPRGYTDNGDDCDDSAPLVNPGQQDIPDNGIDDDCSGRDYTTSDFNHDGYPEIVVSNYYNGSSYSTSSYVYWGSAKGVSNSMRTDANSGSATFLYGRF